MRKDKLTLSAQNVGADPSGTASSEIQQHVSALDPHEQYAKKTSLGTAAARSTTALAAGAPLMEQYYRNFRAILSYDTPLNFPLGISAGIIEASKFGASGAYVSVISSISYTDYSGYGAMAQWYANDSATGIGVRVAYPAGDGNYYFKKVQFRTVLNTTVDANGFIKNASPIARLYGSEMHADGDNDYVKSGFATVNHDANGVSAVRERIGVYRVTGSLGFAKDGWYIETPADANGNKLLFVEYEQYHSGDILIKTFSPDYSTGRCMAGEPQDIPDGRWIDLRLSMPIAE